MRDEWNLNTVPSSSGSAAVGTADSRSSQGLTRPVGRQSESGGKLVDRRSGLDRSASLTMAHKAMKLKGVQGGKGGVGEGMGRKREVSERRQVGDAESLVNQPSSMDDAGKQPWWRNVGMEEGL